MSHENGHRTYDFLKGLAFGGAVGATLGILFAPQSGEETLDQFRQKGDELRDRVSQTALMARSRAELLAEEAKSKAEDLEHRGLEYVSDQKLRIEKTAQAAKRAAQETWNEPA